LGYSAEEFGTFWCPIQVEKEEDYSTFINKEKFLIVKSINPEQVNNIASSEEIH